MPPSYAAHDPSVLPAAAPLHVLRIAHTSWAPWQRTLAVRESTTLRVPRDAEPPWRWEALIVAADAVVRVEAEDGAINRRPGEPRVARIIEVPAGNPGERLLIAVDQNPSRRAPEVSVWGSVERAEGVA